MNIRLETPADFREVENLTREAFWNVYRPGCTEHYVLNQYRSNPDFIPELDLVMEEDGRIIGHVMFSKAELVLPNGTRKPSWTFGPISIHPEYKRKGYGLLLLNYALERAREMGVGFLCMEGNIDFYKHAGFSLASRFGIHYHGMPCEDEVPFFLAQELIPGWLKATGISDATYCPPKGYFVADENPEAFEVYEATFPPKEKLRLPGQLGYEEYIGQVKIRITAIRKASYPDLMAKYENPIEHACEVQEGQEWISIDGQCPEGMCPSAWGSMREFVEALARGEGNFYDGWMKNPMSAMISCNDGFRPVSFYIETI